MKTYGWVIDHDLNGDGNAGRAGDPVLIGRLRADDRYTGQRFIMSDADGIPLLHGRLLDEGNDPAAEFAPLDRHPAFRPAPGERR